MMQVEVEMQRQSHSHDFRSRVPRAPAIEENNGSAFSDAHGMAQITTRPCFKACIPALTIIIIDAQRPHSRPCLTEDSHVLRIRLPSRP